MSSNQARSSSVSSIEVSKYKSKLMHLD
uniref:Uncharacterized protein n=1 Tax=Arundo donax TaxID=35708 RepID=A0A0A8Y8B3_ARUDO